MKNEHAVLFFAALFLLALLASPLAAKEPRLDGGYYMIGTAEELGWFRDAVNKGNFDINAKLVADIDLGGATWTPIGDGSRPDDADERETFIPEARFNGAFDGQGHTVSNFKVTGKNYVGGFFGHIDGSWVSKPPVKGELPRAIVKNLHIKGAAVSFANEDNYEWCYLGAIAGHTDKALIENCTVTKSEIFAQARADAGGIVGYMEETTIASCSVTGTAVKVHAYNRAEEVSAGGIVGAGAVSYNIVTDCVAADCIIDAYARYWSSAGGIAAYGHGSYYKNIRSIGNKISAATSSHEGGYANASGIDASGGAPLMGAISAYNTITAEANSHIKVGGIGGNFIYGCTAVDNVISAVSENGKIFAGGIGAGSGWIYDSSVYGGTVTAVSRSRSTAISKSGHGGGASVFAGGVTGFPEYSHMENCSASGIKISVTANAADVYAGGLTAKCENGIVTKSTVFGDTGITISGGGKRYVGGLVGYLTGDAQLFESVAASLSLSVSRGTVLGAIVGCKTATEISTIHGPELRKPKVENIWYLDTIAEKAVGKDKDAWSLGAIAAKATGKDDVSDVINVTAFQSDADPATLDAVTYAIDKVAKIKKGGSETLSVLSFPGTKNAAAGGLTWAISDPSVAAHSANGIATTITGVKPGGSLIAYVTARVHEIRIFTVETIEMNSQLASAVFVIDQDIEKKQ